MKTFTVNVYDCTYDMTTPSSSNLLSGGTTVYYDSGTGKYQSDVFSNPPDDTLTIASTSQN